MRLDKDMLNKEVLFRSRKNFGMLGNIQWHVTEIQDNKLYVQVSSPRTDLDQNTIKESIITSIEHSLTNVDVHINWIPWKREHGRGSLVSVEGKSPDQIVKELMNALRK